MSKLILIAVLACVVWKMVSGRWPWEKKTLPPRGGDAANGQGAFALAQARALLGVPDSAGRKDILDAHRRKLAEVHPDRGGSNEQVHAANAARDTLLAALDPGAQG
ncbi:J domain-containing protein [Novosphingobium sp. 9]|uniref:J domain-containing protein n=1 Tax=Novosphingobium sp. 9 TaxID=2025349 RepID=UPI0021B660E5|nr:J domain-containing protein [Novosphingobium sp. 9]